MSIPLFSESLFNIELSEKKERLFKSIQDADDNVCHLNETELYQLCGYLNSHYRGDQGLKDFGVVWVDSKDTAGFKLEDHLDFILFVSCFNNRVFVCIWHGDLLITMNENPKDELLQPLTAVIKKAGLNVTDTISLNIETNNKTAEYTLAAYFCCVVSKLYYRKRNAEIIIERLEEFMDLDGFLKIGKNTLPVVNGMAIALRRTDGEQATGEKMDRKDLFCFNEQVKMFC